MLLLSVSFFLSELTTHFIVIISLSLSLPHGYIFSKLTTAGGGKQIFKKIGKEKGKNHFSSNILKEKQVNIKLKGLVK